MKLLITSLAVAGLLSAQAPNPTSRSNQTVTLEGQPLYRVTVVQRTAQAVNYRHRSGATKIDFKGTELMPKSRGEAKVESKQGYIEIEVEFDDLNPPEKYGPEFLTYVMWAISPEGRAQNLGEVILNGTKSKLNVSSDLQSFGMIVTAEPYYAVTKPSNVVVMENVVRRDTLGKVDVIDAKYELLERGAYVYQANNSSVTRNSNTRDSKKIPLELSEARNAVQIAQWTGADKYASDTYEKAMKSLKQAEDYYVRKQKKPTAMIAREAVQTAEDARLITLKRIDEERLATERRLAAEREAAERAKAAESARQQQLEAERRAQAEASAKQANLDRQSAEQARAAAETERLAAERAKAEADAARQAALVQQQSAQAAAEQSRLMAEQQRQAAEASRLAAEQSNKLRLGAEQDKEALRKQLLDQFNSILETRDSARGLIVNMSDVLFDTGRYALRPAAREKLARVSGIVLSHPGLKIEVEGHTDSVGGDSYNQRLSEQRADSVRDYLLSQGLKSDSLTAKGFGEGTPVASNDAAAGRQQNRRVELVVSGDVIGTSITTLRSTQPAPQQ